MNMLSEDFNKIQNEDNENKGKYYYKARFKYYAPYQSIFLNFNPMNMFNTASFERFIVDEENKSKIDNFLNTAEAEYTIRKKERKQNITDNDCIICSCYSDCIDKLKYPQYKVFSIIAKVFDNWS